MEHTRTAPRALAIFATLRFCIFEIAATAPHVNGAATGRDLGDALADVQGQ